MAFRLMLPLQSVKHQIRNVYLNFKVLSRSASSEVTTQKLGECVAVSDDGNIIACWHPEKPILYEHTRPISNAELDDNPGVLKKVDFANLQRPKPDEMVRERLMALTATTKHRWFPRSRDKKNRKRPVDREYL